MKYFKAPPTGGSAQWFVKNDGPSSVTLRSLQVNGEPIERLHAASEVSWWRLLPGMLPPGQTGSLSIRYKSEPKGGIAVLAEFSDGSVVRSEMFPSKDSPGFRFESIGFAPDRSRIVTYFRRYGDAAGDRLDTIWLNGQPVRTDWLTQSFWNNQAGAELLPEKWPATGSYAHFRARSASGKTVSCLLRVGDGFVQAGVYDEPRFLDRMSLARSGMSTVGAHRHFTRDQLDFFHRLGMRVSSYSDGAVPSGDLLHPAHDVLYVFDEPDCFDFVHWDKNPAAPPENRRVGYYGPQVVAAAERIRAASRGAIQSGVVLDNTYTPTNWYEYGETCDVILQDTYVLPMNVPMDYLLAAVSTTLSAAAPLPQIHAYECTWHQKPDKAPGFNRPKTADEFRRIMLMPLGAGAKGLIGWWNVVDEAPGHYISHKVTEFPDQWIEQSTIYATMNQLAPLIAIGHPFYGIRADNPRAWVGGLLAGKHAALVTVVNEDIDYSNEVSVQRPLEHLAIKLPAIPWMNKPAKAVRVNGFEQFAVQMKIGPDGAATLLLPRVVAADIVLVSPDADLPARLLADQQSKLGSPGSQARRLFNADWEAMRRDGRAAAILRDLTLNRNENMVACTPIGEGGGYLAPGSQDRPLDNRRCDATSAVKWQTVRPAKPYNLVEWGLEYHDQSRKKPKPVGMSVPVKTRRAGRAVIAFQIQYGTGQFLDFTLLDANGIPVKDAISDRVDLPNLWIACEVKVPAAGEYAFHITETGPFPGGKSWGSKWSYVVPGMTLEQVSQNLPAPVEFAALPVKVLQWSFENNLKDTSGNGNHGTPAGDARYVPGRFGKALARTAGVMVTKKAAAKVPQKATSPWTMNIWLCASDVPGWSQICGFQDASSQWGTVRFITNDRGFNFWAHNSGLASGVEFPCDWKWHMVTLVWNGSRVRMFFDGQFTKAGQPQTADFSGLADIAQANVAIGDPNTKWIGAVDEFTIWDGALADEHVKRLFATNRIEAAPASGSKE